MVRESSDVVSVYLTGRRLDRLPLRAGQFLNVRFLAAGMDPGQPVLVVCIAPNGQSLRITAKALGEGSARLAHLRPGTRALFEGPYGRLSSRARTQRKVVLAGAGVGITPLRALAEGLDYAPGEAIILQRYTDEPLFVARVASPCRRKGLQVVSLPGPRRTRDSVLGPAARGMPRADGTASAGSPTWPSVMSSSAARPPGPTASKAWSHRRRSAANVSTPKALDGETDETNRLLAGLDRDHHGAAVRLPHLDQQHLGRGAPRAAPAAPRRQQASSSTRADNSGPTAAPPRSRTYTGSVAQTRWGPVQVQITVTSGKIIKVTVLQQPNGNSQGRGDQRHALPILIQDTLDAQSANIDMVSGATVTSEGYVQSLQSALDEAGI